MISAVKGLLNRFGTWLLNLAEFSDSARFAEHPPSGDRVATGAETVDRCLTALYLPALQKEKHLKAALNPSTSLGPNLGI
jgi:hypothetical protein